MILAHLGLVDAGSWQGDEWLNFALLRQGGMFFWTNRVLTWSPRPLSEAMVLLYGRAVEAAGRPLVAPFLLLEWSLLLLALLPLLAGGREGRGARALLALALGAFFLVGHQVAEVFFWPMGAAAYLTTLACLALLAVLAARGALSGGRGLAPAVAAMTLAALAAEVGAMVAGPLALALLGREVLRARRTGAWRAGGRCCLLLAPLAASLGVLWLVLHGRASAGVALGAETRTIHRLGPSLLAALDQFAREVPALDAYPARPGGLLLGAMEKLSLFGGLAWCCARGLRGSAARLRGAGAVPALLLAGALLGGAFLSLAAAFWQFGLACCQRHDTARQCLQVLALFVLAAAAAAGWRGRAWRPWRLWGGPLCLLLASGIALSHRGPEGGRLPALLHDWRQHGAFTHARAEEWRSGQAPGPAMRFPLPPPGRVVGELDWPGGTWSMPAPAGAATAPWYVLGILLFFGKGQVTVVPP